MQDRDSGVRTTNVARLQLLVEGQGAGKVGGTPTQATITPHMAYPGTPEGTGR